jgi:arsenical pump membrane protein
VSGLAQTRELAWAIAALAAAGVVVRPFRLPEAVWAVTGAALVVVLGLLPPALAWRGLARGGDVYLFLTGMMLLSETARREGLFDWVAAAAVNRAKGSPRRLFLLVYGVGAVVTTFLSNDATAVVLTPAVYAVSKKADADPLPYLFICAFIANAASFVLPISNPANLVLYGDHTPPLSAWIASFAMPSVLAIAATYAVLRWVEGSKLAGACARDVDQPELSPGGWAALAGVGLAAVALPTASALDVQLGLPTFIVGALTAAFVLIWKRASPLPLLAGVSWAVLPLVGGLFVLVEALDRTGLTVLLAGGLNWAAHQSETGAALAVAGSLAVASNLMNNLPAGLIANSALVHAHAARKITDAALVGIDLGPNLSITGSLATILWLAAIRREGQDVSFWRFLKLGLLAMPAALLAALAALLL